MKIIKLELCAFGPFKDKEEISFLDFEENRIFLIGGKTGSGKTTIFDAISYALFGKMTGEFRDDSTCRSQYAEKDVPTFVRLTFSKDSKTYEIYRKPRYFVEGRKTAYNPEICFKEITDGIDKVISIKIADANLKIIDVIGFKYEQFKQIVVLPQGEFIKILNAKSKEREELLSAILDTSLYSNITNILKDRSKELYNKINTVTIKTDGILNEYKVNNIEELKIKETDLKSSLDTKRKLVDEETNKYQSLDKKIEEIDKNNLNLAKLESNKKALNDLINNNPTIDTDKKYLKKLKAVKDLSGEYHILDGKKNEFYNENKIVDKNEKLLEALMPEYNKLEEMEALEEEYTNKLIELNKSLKEFEGMKLKNDKLSSNLSNIEKANASILKLSDTINHLNEGIAKAKGEIDSLKAKVDNNLSFINSYDNDLYLNSKEIYNKYQLRVDLENKLKGYEAILNEAKEALNNDKETLLILQNEEERIEGIIKHNELLRFKDLVKDDTPCPLCGSVHHPHVITAGEIGSISIDSIKKRISDINQKINKNEAKIEVNNKEITSIKENENYSLDLSKLDEVKKIYDKTSLDQKKYFDLSKENNNLNSKISELDGKIKQAQDLINDYVNKQNDLKLKLSELKIECDNLKIELDNYLNGEDINKLFSLKSNEIKHLEALKASQISEIDRIKKEYTRLKTTIKGNYDRIDELNKIITDLNVKFRHKLIDLGIPEDEYEVEVLNLDYIPSIEARVNKYDKALNEYKTTIDVLSNIITSNEIVDTNSLKNNLLEIKANLDSLNNEYLSINSSYSVLSKAIKDYTKLTESIKDTLDEYKTVEYMFELCNGQLSGCKKISIQKFVLMKLLDRILSFANHYLKLFSSSRYTLYREESDSNSDKGLELVVYDDHTGYQRSVSSLSGGESFMTALALALGMSECIMQMNGGIKMENIFIDEGFGTLDDEALNNAIEALIELAQGGRLIGIISHVDSIKALIPQGIDVIKSKHGSKININL